MDPIIYNPQDKEYFLGEVLERQLDPEATFYSQPPPGHVFNPAWPVQNFTYPADGPILIKKLQFVADEATGEGQLVTYILTRLQGTRLNMITNPTLEQATQGTMPRPLIPLKPGETIIPTKDPASSGLFAGALRWMVVDTTKTPKPPISSPEGGSYTNSDRTRDNQLAIDVRDIKRALGI